LSGGVTDFLTPTVPSGPVEITAGPPGDDHLWFSEYSANKIGEVDPASGMITEFEIPGGGPGTHPESITAGPDGKLWVLFSNLSSGNDQVEQFDPTTRAFTAFPVPTNHAQLGMITTGPDGNLWFTEWGAAKIGRITTDGQITELPALTPGSLPLDITAGPDGGVWFIEERGNKIGRVDPTTLADDDGFPIPTPASDSWGIAFGPDGNLWFTEHHANQAGRLDLSTRAIAEFPLPPNSGPIFIARCPDGNLWIAEEGTNKVARMTAGGEVTGEFAVPTAGGGPFGITAGPDGNVWFAEQYSHKVGKIYLLSATGAALTAAAGQRFADVVASFHDDEPGMAALDYTALVDWGDGSPLSTGGVSADGDGTWDVAASHTYADPGSYPVTVTVIDTHPGGMTATATGTAVVGLGPPGAGDPGLALLPGPHAAPTPAPGPSAAPVDDGHTDRAPSAALVAGPPALAIPPAGATSGLSPSAPAHQSPGLHPPPEPLVRLDPAVLDLLSQNLVAGMSLRSL
jgi:streptogramin lyase